MAITSYRLYCENCNDDTVVRRDEDERSTDWNVESLIDHSGICPSCDPTINVDELQSADGGEDVGEGEVAQEEPIDLLTLDSIGEKAASNLRRKGYDTVESIAEASDEKLLDVKWVGSKGLLSLRERAKQLEPQKRW